MDCAKLDIPIYVTENGIAGKMQSVYIDCDIISLVLICGGLPVDFFGGEQNAHAESIIEFLQPMLLRHLNYTIF